MEEEKEKQIEKERKEGEEKLALARETMDNLAEGGNNPDKNPNSPKLIPVCLLILPPVIIPNHIKFLELNN